MARHHIHTPPPAAAPARAAASAPRPAARANAGRLRCSCGGSCPRCAQQAVAAGPQALAATAGQPLDAGTQRWMETRFGRSFGHVRVHHDAAAQAATAAMSARAFALGNHLAFAPGQFQPGSSAGRRLIAHELAHTLQQGQGGPVHGGGEHAADAASAAVLAGRPVPAQPGHAAVVQRDGPALDLGDLRSPFRFDPSLFRTTRPPVEPYSIEEVLPGDSADERIVRISTGQRYRVRRRQWVTTETGSRRRRSPDVDVDIDTSEVWMTVEWCEGASEGSVRLAADAPEQVLRAIGAAALSGGDIGGAVAGMSLTPTLEARVQIGTVNIRLTAEATVDTEGRVTGAEGSIGTDFNTPAGRVGVGLRGRGEDLDSPGGGSGSIGLELTFTPGGRNTAPDCDRVTERVIRHTAYDCDELITVPASRREVTERVPQTDRRTHFLYYPYWSSRIDRRRSAAEQAAIVAALGDGFAVASVRGFASPEGARAEDGRFEGNDALSTARADAALAWLRGACGERGAACLPPGVAAEGGSERHTLTEPAADGSGSVEVEGDRQATHAADAFSTDPDEAAQRTPAVEAALARARTPGERAAVVYPQLRRVEVVLTRTREVERQRTIVTPERTDTAFVEGGCPARLRDAAFPPARRL